MSATRELVLGSEGLIGASLVEALRRRGHLVEGLDLKTGSDLRHIGDTPFRRCERVWFLAWDSGGVRHIEARERQHEIFRNNSELAARVFDALERTGKPFLFTSSQLAGVPSAYGLTTLLGEHWTRQLGGRLARLWNVYGWEEPGPRSHVVTDLVLRGLRDGTVACLTDGRERRRFLYKSDAAEALIALFDSDEETADVAGDGWVAIREVAREIAAQLGVDAQFGPDRGSELIAEPQGAPAGWAPVVSLRDGIARTIGQARAFLAALPRDRLTA